MDPKESLVRMFEAFAPRESERWTYLLSRDPRKWDKITPLRIWPGGDAFASVPDVPLPELLASPLLKPHLRRDAVVLRCGHCRDRGLGVMPLGEVFPGGEWVYDIIFEGFVSIVPGKLALGLNHEGGICVFGA
ncbi:MAG TPA: hypothetical protein VNB23_10540 [Ramlibacter sp.]|nr:hypothetical protein [Ramlibacter sp.]